MNGLPSVVAADPALEGRRSLWVLMTSPRAGIALAFLAFLLAFGLGFLRAGSALDVKPAGRATPSVATPSSRPNVRDEKSGLMATVASTQTLQWPLWEYKLQQPLPAREAPLTPVSWRLLGAVLDQGQWKIIVTRQGKDAPEFFRVGEKLPGGYLIRAITQDDVTLVAGRRELILAYIGSR